MFIGQTVTENDNALCDVVTCLLLKVASVELPEEVRASLLSSVFTKSVKCYFEPGLAQASSHDILFH